ncbi:nucleoside transporter [Psychrosphaera sp. B3R10]|uniref:nucleoside transporter n=1 Tax=unclassified Psychrosphaera TaxID=2641570 RepID=UPI001C084D92|nr:MULTISPECIES: nucleoside transporter [unclassified Psychrosphaera]MBU2883559.1 nucleoside transporter [Psychrosphaera sp. I2R16]MBU2989738.1 nucleoside transporter [Psychrosphaera sp. B3R10]MDO6719807.1 nucleoside transporter [Psychrosphaera sp. 1_MG-2023]
MSAAEEFESVPVSAEKLQGPKTFAASYAGEHVAGTEFVIGALFVSWGVGAVDVLVGLLIGNLLAVLTWGLVTAPIATDTRLTLYAYLEKIAGPGTIRFYSVINGILFCVLAGAMITVSASAVRIPFGIPDQVGYFPTDWRFVAVVLGVGAVVVYMAVKGFKKLAAFAEVCAPWMILMFIVGAFVMMPTTVAATANVDSINSFNDFLTVASDSIWKKTTGDIGIMHVIAFAWVANLAMHGSLGDMTLLRFAKSPRYGYFSALGMFIGHYIAWICAGVMGAGAAILLNTTITAIDPGSVAYTALGTSGILAVIIAGWTTSNPTIYRAGLAFSSLNQSWGRTRVTIVVGIITTIIACSPFVFSGLLGFVGYMGLLLAPVGAIIVAEHWLFNKIGLTRYWSSYKGNTTNWAALSTWVVSMLVGIAVEQAGVLHLFFILVPLWIFATAMYVALASVMGAKETYPEAAIAEQAESDRKAKEAVYLAGPTNGAEDAVKIIPLNATLAKFVSWGALVACALLGLLAYANTNIEIVTSWLIIPTLVYFVTATYAYLKSNSTQ